MLTVVIIAKNEANKISKCLDALTFADEILLVNNGSTDKTAKIASEFNANIIDINSETNFSKMREVGLKNAKSKWVLFIDADEIVSTDLAKEVKSVICNPRFSSYLIRRQDHFMGRILKYGEVSDVFNNGAVRLVKKGSGKWNGAIHEVFIAYRKPGKINAVLDHYSHQTLKEFVKKVNLYSNYRAKELHDKGMRTSWLELIFIPLFKFFYTYFYKQGFRDGAQGFIYSFIMSFHSFLVKSKLYNMSV